MPSRAASAFMRATKPSLVPPTFSPIAMAMSLAELHQHHLQRIVERHHRARLVAHLGRLFGCRILGNLDRRRQFELTGLDRPEGDVGRHQLGQRCRMPALESLFMGKHLAGLQVEQQRRIGVGATGQQHRRKRGADEKSAKKVQVPHVEFRNSLLPWSPRVRKLPAPA